ncbi:hypothetical protein Kpol_260p4 [Vanderwaltozyma polyspora DSM 70294]|uniref:Copper transport protein n=1 Tax=Vanderwaltozyma polyspora (strain ATCC 22028 / DSM 70294 / BCRC 21397 / CBS 2163 / NBRC 10782 / NRRL Y-8283 / UCD 57-17) TaxID=436907 RepID=A7TTF5_VANPO|nr:uncharacterized protein Kpol_260p4 [Vanderwaltozyma polyspora DSM 70294]EDO14454.1 hypothetical protein Kpol_260p4 [Vanderwaltozyma polyspora DSM 70294]
MRDHSSHKQMASSAMQHDHGDMGGDSCSMNMIFTWNYKNTCVVFRWWHIKTVSHLILSMLAIMFLTYLYEYLKYCIYKRNLNNVVVGTTTNLNSVGAKRVRFKKSIWYSIQVGYSFMLMLVFMTYNGWLMLAVVLGALWGHYCWGSLTENCNDTNSLACH